MIDHLAPSRSAALLARYGLAHHLHDSQRAKNAAAGFNPYSYNDPRHEPMQCEIERIQRVRAARGRRQRSQAQNPVPPVPRAEN